MQNNAFLNSIAVRGAITTWFSSLQGRMLLVLAKAFSQAFTDVIVSRVKSLHDHKMCSSPISMSTWATYMLYTSKIGEHPGPFTKALLALKWTWTLWYGACMFRTQSVITSGGGTGMAIFCRVFCKDVCIQESEQTNQRTCEWGAYQSVLGICVF